MDIKSNFTYYMPTKIIYGCGKIFSINRYIKKEKVLLLISNTILKTKILQKLNINKNIIFTISDIKSHPDIDDIGFLLEKIKKLDFNLIVAIGGGSVLDMAKILSIKDIDIIKNNIKNGDSIGFNNIPIISIPTTAGTGSEITPWATIWDRKNKKKYSLHSLKLFSKIAIYDPKLTLSLPKNITIQTALDTLSHALESIWNKNANEITIRYATISAKLIIENLISLIDNLDNLNYRDKVMKASMYAGLAFSNTQTAIAHAISYYITLHKNIPHGIACSFTLPILIDNIIGKYDFIDKALIDIFGELSSKKLRKIFDKLSISYNFLDYKIDKNDIANMQKLISNNQRAKNSLIVDINLD